MNLQDLRFGFRMLRRSLGFSLLAILCLTLGIGATTSVFSWIEGILLRPFPLVKGQERMVALTGTFRTTRNDVSWPDFKDLEKNSTLLDSFIVDRIFGTTLAIGDRADRAVGAIVTSNYFRSIGVQPMMGRTFEPAEDVGRNAHPVTVISYLTWKERYGSDPAIIGKTQMMNGVQNTIIGVMPEGFHGTFVGYSFNFWVPVSMQETFDRGGYKLEDRGAEWIEGYARLKPGVSLAQAQAEVSAIAKRLENAYPATNRGRGIRLYPLWETPFNNAGTLFPTLRIALVVVCFVLLIACANVGNLLLARSVTRRHEMTVRLAMGAGRARLLKQLLTEGFILTIIAAGCGFLLSYWCRNLIVLAFPVRSRGITINLPAEIDWRVLAISAGICMLSTLLIGLMPALQAGKIDIAVAMKSESSSVVGGRGRSFVRSGLVLVQVALSFVLLVGTGLLLKSLRGIQDINPGFATRGVLTTSIDFTAAGYDRTRIRSFEDSLAERVQALPGVTSVSYARVLPFSFTSYSSAPVDVDGYEAPPDERQPIEYNEVGPGYFTTVGIPLLSGREFTRADNETSLPVAVVTDVMVEQYWRGQDPVGKRLKLKDRWLQVVGVARSSKYRSLIETPKPFFYVPALQSAPGSNFFIRTQLSPETLANAFVTQVHALDNNLAPMEVLTMESQVERSTWTQRAAVKLLGIFGGMALVLAAIGLYGVMAYTVSQSTRELGLRMALGAAAPDLVRLVMSYGLGLTAGGVVLGAALALGLMRLMGDLLNKVSPHDPVAFGSAFGVMAVVSVAACLLPALRAAGIDPVRALRD